LADALIRRKDLGRRRTLGANRWDLTSLVALRATLVALIGALAGAILGLVWTSRTAIHVPPSFAAALVALAVIAAGIASIAPAIYAARRDPVTVMRTP
ncbi:MAG TPA: ABC transporter permease, partial [Propionibacteriaceae bacterium]|nr:ABC transporter permease [Propionibacteriaceae bacterium]